MAASVTLGGFTLYSGPAPAIATVILGGFSMSPTATVPTAPAKVVLGGFTLLQPTPARLVKVYWNGVLSEVNEWVFWNGELLSAPGNV